MIKKLSDKIIRQIAAGEVISKPYNAVKELIENSIDAGASTIQIFFKEYGMQSIIVIDNGSGITKEDLSIAKELHTTSKTNEYDNMFGIKHFGFRGEALASIDAISDLTIESNGYKLEKNVMSHSTMQNGTKITINNLFKNVPARLKFIKNPQTEFQITKDLIKKYIIQHNELNWLINLNGKIIWNLKKDTKENRINILFKEEGIKKETKNENANVKAYILKNKSNISYIFVNKRPIKDKNLVKYISSLFKEYTFINENPGYILDILIDPLFVDYNVHPSKEEVRFINYNIIFSLLNEIFTMNQLAKNLNPSEIIFSIETKKERKKDSQQTEKLFATPIFQRLEKMNVLREDDLSSFQISSYNEKKIFHHEKMEENKNQDWGKDIIPLFNLIGQLKNAYILFENENGLGIFDQHAAHERKFYEQIKKELNKNSAQKLLSPIEISLTPKINIFLEENITNLEAKGIFIENQTIIALPVLFKNISELIALLQNLVVPCDISTEIERLLANIACKNALKANTPLSMQQMQTLLKEALINPPICNHGRPVFKYFSNNEIKNFFKRT